MKKMNRNTKLVVSSQDVWTKTNYCKGRPGGGGSTSPLTVSNSITDNIQARCLDFTYSQRKAAGNSLELQVLLI